MDFKPIGVDKTKTIKIKTNLGEVDFTPTFSEGEVVTLKPAYKNYSTEFTKMYGKEFIVNYCKVANLGDMVVEVVNIKNQDINTCELVNPYLVKHFKLV